MAYDEPRKGTYASEIKAESSGLEMKIQGIGGSLIDIHQRLEKIGDRLYGAGPRAVSTNNPTGSMPSIKTVLDDISQTLAACDNELSRIERGL